MKKLITILLCITTLLALCACSNEDGDSSVAPSATQIAYNGQEMAVSSIILHCGDKFYGIEVDEGVNFSNQNNYFTTTSGLTVILTDENLEPGINKDDGITSIQELEDGLFLVVKGNDEKTVNNVFKHIYKTNGERYQMFKHDIASEWTAEVVITNDVISFSNGDETTYIYQNPGSLSDGCYKGHIEPTVFYKQLRGIDIPITYPEVQEVKEMTYAVSSIGANGSIVTETLTNMIDYTPYGYNEYEHMAINNFIPYSAYDIDANAYGYIILANSNINVLNLFESFNNIYSRYIILNITDSNTFNYSIDINTVDLSKYYNYASDIVNSDNRYHFNLITSEMENDDFDNVNMDLNSQLKEDLYYYINANNKGVDYVMNDMQGILVMPTIKTGEPLYNRTDFGDRYPLDVAYAAQIEGNTIRNHGSYGNFDNYLWGIVNGGVGGNYLHGNHLFMLEGDFIYKFDNNYHLSIYKNVSTTLAPENGYVEERSASDFINTSDDLIKNYDISTQSCSEIVGANSLYQNYLLVSSIIY